MLQNCAMPASQAKVRIEFILLFCFAALVQVGQEAGIYEVLCCKAMLCH